MTPLACGPEAQRWEQVRTAAETAALLGWPVVPGTYIFGRRWYGHLGGCQELRPTHDNWESRAITAPGEVAALWSLAPFSVLLVCGRGVNVLELPPSLARGRFINWRTLGAPIATVFPPSRRLVFVTSGPLRSDLAERGAVLHGAGRWIALPPIPFGRWEIPPTTGAADSARVQLALANALRPDADG